MTALDALEGARTAELLITRVEFGPGQPHGVALARMARLRRPEIKILFTARPEYEKETVGLGEFMPLPVSTPSWVEAAKRLLALEN